MKAFDVASWVDDAPMRKAFAARGLDYDAQRASTANHEVSGEDGFCKRPITDPRKAGEIWVKDGDILPYASAACTLGAVNDLKTKGREINVAYVFDTSRGIKLFAREAFYVVGGGEIAPYLLKRDAEAAAAKSGAKVLPYDEAVKAAVAGG